MPETATATATPTRSRNPTNGGPTKSQLQKLTRRFERLEKAWGDIGPAMTAYLESHRECFLPQQEADGG